jgi:hypothetical protein
MAARLDLTDFPQFIPLQGWGTSLHPLQSIHYPDSEWFQTLLFSPLHITYRFLEASSSMFFAAAFALASALVSSAANITVQVGAGGLNFSPTNVKAEVGDLVIFQLYVLLCKDLFNLTSSIIVLPKLMLVITFFRSASPLMFPLERHAIDIRCALSGTRISCISIQDTDHK